MTPRSRGPTTTCSARNSPFFTSLRARYNSLVESVSASGTNARFAGRTVTACAWLAGWRSGASTAAASSRRVVACTTSARAWSSRWIPCGSPRSSKTRCACVASWTTRRTISRAVASSRGRLTMSCRHTSGGGVLIAHPPRRCRSPRTLLAPHGVVVRRWRVRHGPLSGEPCRLAVVDPRFQVHEPLVLLSLSCALPSSPMKRRCSDQGAREYCLTRPMGPMRRRMD